MLLYYNNKGNQNAANYHRIALVDSQYKVLITLGYYEEFEVEMAQPGKAIDC